MEAEFKGEVALKIIKGDNIYLSALKRDHCKVLYSEDEYDFQLKAELLNIGYSVEGADEWFEDIQRKQGKENIRLGIFLNSGDVVGDIALQGIDWKNCVLRSKEGNVRQYICRSEI